MRAEGPALWFVLLAAGLLAGTPGIPSTLTPVIHDAPAHANLPTTAATNPSVSNFTNAISRIVELLGLSGSGLLAIVWTRVALSWFSNDVTKKVQAKERARDALIGTILFTAAVSGLLYGLAYWVVTGA